MRSLTRFTHLLIQTVRTGVCNDFVLSGRGALGVTSATRCISPRCRSSLEWAYLGGGKVHHGRRYTEVISPDPISVNGDPDVTVGRGEEHLVRSIWCSAGGDTLGFLDSPLKCEHLQTRAKALQIGDGHLLSGLWIHGGICTFQIQFFVMG